MAHTSTPQLRLPTQARPVHRTGSPRAGVSAGGVEPAFLGNLFDVATSIFGGPQPRPTPIPLPLPLPTIPGLPFPFPSLF